MMKIRSTVTILAVILALVFTLPQEAFGQGKEKPKGPPSWAPAHGYRAQTRHVYFPEQNFYFDVQNSVYIYMSANTWKVDVELPSVYLGMDLRAAAKVELELDTNTPQNYNSEHVVKYKTKNKSDKQIKKTGKGQAGKAKGKKK